MKDDLPRLQKYLRKVFHTEALRVVMPPRKSDMAEIFIQDEQIATLEKWVALGAPWPVSISLPDAERRAKQLSHWAFQPVQVVEPPIVKETDWCRTPVDQFVLAKRESQPFSHSPAADRRTHTV